MTEVTDLDGTVITMDREKLTDAERADRFAVPVMWLNKKTKR